MVGGVDASIVSQGRAAINEKGGATISVIDEDVTGKYVHARLSVVSGIVDQIIGVVAGDRFRPVHAPLPGQSPSTLLDLPAGESIPGVLDVTRARPNPLPPGPGGVRGAVVERLAAAALLAPCATPTRPPVMGRASSLTP